MRRGITAIAIAIALGLTGTAQAATYQVTKRGDHAPGACTQADCTLREAVLKANVNPGADTIRLPSRKPYKLSIPGDDDGGMMGDLDVTNDPLKIVHPGKGRATIDANGVDRVLNAYASLRIRKLRLTGGSADYGGGIRASTGRLTVIDSVIAGNAAVACGGGIHTQDDIPLVLVRSRVSGNLAGSDGGGISASCFGGSGPVTIKSSKVVGNRSDSVDNMIGRGGGIYLQTSDGTQSAIVKSTFAGNRTGPGGHPTGANEGGAIYTDSGRLRITGSTINGNASGDNGGGISVDGTEPLAITNSTITRNRANDTGGGIALEAGVVRMNAATVVRNRGNADGVLSEPGGGLFVDSGETFTVRNSLIALNTLTALTPGDPPVKNDCSGADPFVSGGRNLLSTRFLCQGFDGPGDRKRANPKLGKLRSNGGPTKTVALKRRSAAIGKAKKSTAPKRDQRGRKRDKRPDIGAFERGA